MARHIRDVPNKEERWWRELLGDFRRKADPYVQSLETAKENYCGVKLMEQILVDKMCYIVKNTLPQLQSQLEKREQQYKDYLAKLQKDMELDDPEKLKQRVSEFHHKYLETLKQFYQGRDLAAVRDFRQTWNEDMNEFRNKKHFRTVHQNAQDWDNVNYIHPGELEELLLDMDRQDLVHKARAGLLGGVAVRRALDLWIVMMSLMPFPDYTHEDILNASDPFGATIQADPWIMVRNIVYHASVQLRKGCIWFGEYLRYRLKRNADIVFQSCLTDAFLNTVRAFGSGHGAGYGNNAALGGANRNLVIGMNRPAPARGFGNRKRNRNRNRNRTMRGRPGALGVGIFGDDTKQGIHGIGGPNGHGAGVDLNANIRKRNKSDQDMQKLLEIGLSDYKKLVDTIVDEFQEAVEVIPADHAEIVDRKFHEDIINLSDLLRQLLDDDLQLVNPERQQIESYVESPQRSKTKLHDERKRKEIALKRRQDQEQFESQSIAIQEKQQVIPQGKGGYGQQKQKKNEQQEAKKDIKDDADPFAAPDDPFNAAGANENNNNGSDTNVNTDGTGLGFDDDNKEDTINPRTTRIRTVAAQRLYHHERFIGLPITDIEKSRDVQFYRTLFPSKQKRHFVYMNDGSTLEIKKLARAVWTCIKKQVITTAQQTLTNRVLAVLKGHGDRCHSALLIGMDWPHIQQLVGQLQDATKIPRAEIEKMIKESSKIEQQKGIGQMTNKEIRDVYGSNIKEITKEYEAMLIEYKAFLQKKEEIKEKIEALQNMDIVEDID